MKDLCIATYVYGENYQSFIPIYIYSVLKNYPDYDVRIYLDNKLLPNIKRQLDMLKGLGNYHIIENFNSQIEIDDKMSRNDQIMRSLRWLIYDDAYINYDAIYVGDIDIFICEEKPGIYEQHINHCNYLGLPYSNCIRKSKLEKSNFKKLIYNLFKFGASETIKFYKNPRDEIKRLTGLHFIRTKDYYNKIYPILPRYMKMLKDVANNKSIKYNKVEFNDEFLLYELISDSGIGLPAESTLGAENDSKDFNSISFRPHHGLHLGIFRSYEGAQRERRLVLGEVYLEYYRQFCNIRKNDEIYMKLEGEFSSYLKKLIGTMDLFYRDNGIINN